RTASPSLSLLTCARPGDPCSTSVFLLSVVYSAWPARAARLRRARAVNRRLLKERSSALHALEDGGETLTAAYAHRLEPEASAAALELPQQRGQDAPAGRAHRMAQRDAGAVHVDSL